MARLARSRLKTVSLNSSGAMPMPSIAYLWGFSPWETHKTRAVADWVGGAGPGPHWH